MVWTFCRILDTNRRPVTDTWTAWHNRGRVLGCMLRPAGTEVLAGVEVRDGRFVGTSDEDQRIVNLVNFNWRKGAKPGVLEDWPAYLATLVT